MTLDELLTAGATLSVAADQRISVALCIDPADLADGGVRGELAALLDHVVLYVGGGNAGKAFAIVHVDRVGRADSLARARLGSIVEKAAGACTWDASTSSVVVAQEPRQIEPVADRIERRNQARYDRRHLASVEAGDPQAVLDAWAAVTDG